MADLDPDSLNKLRVIDLREHLSSRGLPTSGLKAELVKRLREALLSSENGNPPKNVQETNEEPMDVDEEHANSSTDEDDKLKDQSEQSGFIAAVEETSLETEKEGRLKVEDETRLKAEDDARLKSEEEARLKSEEEAMLKAEEEARLKSEEEARLKSEEEARLKSEEEARLKAEEEARLRAEEEARLRAEEEARLKAEEEARLKAEEEARLKAEEEARLKAEEEARVKAEEEVRLKAEEEARLRAEEEAKLRAEEEASLRAEEEASLRAEEEAKLRAEEEAKLRAEEEAKLRAEEEARLRAEKEARLKAEEEARIRVEQEARIRAVQEARIRAEQEAMLRAEQEARLRAEEEARLRAEEETRRATDERQTKELKIKTEAEDEKRKAEETKKRMELEEEMRIEQERWLVEDQMRRAQEEHKKRIKAEEQKRLAEEEERKRKLADEQRRLMEEERQRKAAEEQKRLMEEKQRKAAEEKKRLMEEERQRKAAEEQKRLREEEILLKAAEEQRIQDEETKKRVAEKEKILAEVQQKSMSEEDIKLPQAIEKVLALKSERAQLLGVDPDAVDQPLQIADEKVSSLQKSATVTLVSVDEDEYFEVEEDSISKTKESKSRRRKKKKKKRSARHQESKEEIKHVEKSTSKEADVDVEYVQEVINITDPLYSQFMKIFERFKLTDGEKEKDDTLIDSMKDPLKEESLNPMALRKKPMDIDDDDDDDEKDDDEKIEEEKPKLSKRKLKKLSRMTVAELKQKVNRPELVEMHDVTAKDPVLLLHLKASRNTVPVPRHWCFKRKYLQGKRGIEKPAFELPDFIKRTGIMEMRQALQEKEDQKTMKAKMRERVRPKLGKIDIDYQKLHDAFFKWQTKPKMTIHGDLYYEGKEFETRLKEKKPGDLSEDLRTALGMPTGPNANKCPPPWLIAMQRYGPPPSYPNLKIPGLNAPIPDDCSFGYHAGGWGKPPVDETGRPLYGDVFGTQITDNQPHIQEEEIDHTLWGELESESSEEEEDEDEEEEEDEEEKVEDESGLVTPAEGLITPSGFSSIPAGMETPDMIELRKRKIESEIEGGETPALYTILPEKKGERVGAAMMGSTHIYDLAAAIPASKLIKPGTSSVPPQGIEVALDPSELEMDSAAMAARYEQTMREQQSQLEKEDLSDMVAEHAARQKNKRKKQQLTSAKPPKKYKEFKF